MGAPIANKFWMCRKTHGAPIKYNAEQLTQMWNDYLIACEQTKSVRRELVKSGEQAGKIYDITVDKPLTMKGFSVFTGIDDETLLSYCSKEKENIDKDLIAIATHIRESIADYIDSGCLNGTLVSAYGAKLRGLKDIQQVEQINPEQINISIDGMKIDLTK